MAAAEGQAACCKIRAAAFSPIIIDGALVLPEVSVGMVEASATRKPGDSVNAQPCIHLGHRIGTHLAGADRMIRRVGRVLHPIQDLAVGGLRFARRAR